LAKPRNPELAHRVPIAACDAGFGNFRRMRLVVCDHLGVAPIRWEFRALNNHVTYLRAQASVADEQRRLQIETGGFRIAELCRPQTDRVDATVIDFLSESGAKGFVAPSPF